MKLPSPRRVSDVQCPLRRRIPAARCETSNKCPSDWDGNSKPSQCIESPRRFSFSVGWPRGSRLTWKLFALSRQLQVQCEPAPRHLKRLRSAWSPKGPRRADMSLTRSNSRSSGWPPVGDGRGREIGARVADWTQPCRLTETGLVFGAESMVYGAEDLIR